ncbi:MAG: hypothetical protein ACOX9C_04425 [Kiritimatiellia bacterium]|jgi:hypothetical protein
MRMEDLLGEMPLELLAQALDDDGDGLPDAAAWEAVRESAEERLRNCFGGDVPPRHAQAAAYARKLFTLVTLYNRRGHTAEANPYAAAANRAEERLRRLASGEDSTDGAEAVPAFIGEPAKISGTRGLLA